MAGAVTRKTIVIQPFGEVGTGEQSPAPAPNTSADNDNVQLVKTLQKVANWPRNSGGIDFAPEHE
jgi:hypothetical protein